MPRHTVRQILINRDRMTPQEADTAIQEMKEDMYQRLEDGIMPFNILEEYFQLEPDYLDEYELFFNCPLTFEYPENQIVFKKASLDMPLVSSLPDYHNRIEEKAAEQLERLVSG